MSITGSSQARSISSCWGVHTSLTQCYRVLSHDTRGMVERVSHLLATCENNETVPTVDHAGTKLSAINCDAATKISRNC
jgi:hypothetical protein